MLCLLAGTCGCFSADVADSPVLGKRSGGHAVACNYGWTLFGCVPLVFDGTKDMTASDVIALVKRATFNGIKGVNIYQDVADCNPTGQDRLTFIYQDEWGELMSPGPVREDGPYAWMMEETIPLSAPRAATENPFNVEIMEHRDATRLFVEFNTGLYSEGTARRYAELFLESLSELLLTSSAQGSGTRS